jgi:SH3-like domain-containing protein
MSNKLSILCSSVFLAFAFMAPGFADEHFPFLAEVSKESVNVRAGPNTNFEKVDKLSRGAQVVVLGRSFEWYKVQPMATTKCYIRSDYLSTTASGGVAVVIGNNVNVRASANSNAASLGEVKKGTMVRILGQDKGWSMLSAVAGTAVWINQDFLKQVSPDVPSSMLLQAGKAVLPGAAVADQVVTTPKAPVSPWTSMRGTVEALVQSPDKDVHYEIVLGNKSVFLLKDIPQLGSFCNTQVDLDGALVPDPQKKLMYPVLRINKIVLVL